MIPKGFHVKHPILYRGGYYNNNGREIPPPAPKSSTHFNIERALDRSTLRNVKELEPGLGSELVWWFELASV